MTAKVYKDPFTLDGRLKPGAGVTKAKVTALKTMVESALRGNSIALGTLKEAMTSSDAVFNFAYLTNLNLLPQYDEAPRQWTKVAGTRPVSDFRDATLYNLAATWTEGVLDVNSTAGQTDYVAPVIPEGSPYPFSTLSGKTVKGAHVVKRGFKTDFTFEAFINDALGFIRALPDEMRNVALDTEEYEVFAALVGGAGSGQSLTGGTIPDGTTVPAKAALSRPALIEAKIEMSNRLVQGRRVKVTGRYNLIVAIGQGEYARFVINSLSPQSIQPGSQLLSVNGYNPLSDVDVIESEYVTGAGWYLVPAPGATRIPTLDRLQLIGHESPEVRVANFTGNFVGGAAVSPFEGSFENDSATFRLRVIGNGVLWTPEQVVWSDGSGGAPTYPALNMHTV